METEIEKLDKRRLSNRESVDLTRECIQTALLYLLNEKSYEKITVTDIVKRAGVSRSSFYRNYVDKDDLINSIGQEIYKMLLQNYPEDGSSASVKRLISAIFSSVYEHRKLLEFLKSSDIPSVTIEQTRYMARDIFFKDGDISDYEIDAIISATFQIVLDWYRADMPEPPDEMAELVSSIFSEKLRSKW